MMFPEKFKDLDSQSHLIFLDINELDHRRSNHISKLLINNADQKYIATENLHPYGIRTEEALNQTKPSEVNSKLNLLRIISQEEDYTIFEVPKSMLSVINATLGSNPHRNEVIDNMYQGIGEVIGRTILNVYKINKIGLADFGLNIDNGDLIFIPPFKFRKGESNPDQITCSLIKSIKNNLSPVLSDERIKDLGNFIEIGIDNEYRT